MSLIGFKIRYSGEKIRIIPFTAPFPSFILFKETVLEAFPRLSQELKRLVYFTWFHLNDDIIMRTEIEFQFALQHFWRGNEMPEFFMCFDIPVEEEAVNTTNSKKKTRSTTIVIIPKSDF